MGRIWVEYGFLKTKNHSHCIGQFSSACAADYKRTRAAGAVFVSSRNDYSRCTGFG